MCIPALDKVIESGHVEYDEVTPVKGKKEELLVVVDSVRRVVKNFRFLFLMT